MVRDCLHAVGDPQPTVGGLDVEGSRLGAKRLHLARGQVPSKRCPPSGFGEKAARSSVVHLVISRRLVDERRLIAVACVERDRRRVVVETEVPVETLGEFSQPLRDVSVERRESTLYETTLSAASSRPNTIVEIAASLVRSVRVTTEYPSGRTRLPGWCG